ncbi:MAG: acetate uptake transporter [Acidimicrobiales bacterium]
MSTTTESAGSGTTPGNASAPTPRRVNPAPLAFGAFAGTTFLLSWVNAGMIDESALEAAVATAWVFGGVIQILVAFWHFRNEELFPAVTFGSFGAFWVSFGFFGTLYLGNIPAAEHGAATALFLFPWAVFSLYMLIGALRVSVGVFVAFILVEATLIPLIIGNATGSQGTVEAGGWLGVALAIEVWYLAAAEVLNHQFARTILPLGHLDR